MLGAGAERSFGDVVLLLQHVRNTSTNLRGLVSRLLDVSIFEDSLRLW